MMVGFVGKNGSPTFLGMAYFVNIYAILGIKSVE